MAIEEGVESRTVVGGEAAERAHGVGESRDSGGFSDIFGGHLFLEPIAVEPFSCPARRERGLIHREVRLDLSLRPVTGRIA